MILTDYFESKPNLQWEYAKQAGINHAVIRLPESDSFVLTDASHWKTLYDRFISYGITPLVIEPMPNSVHDHIKTGDEKRDESIEQVIKMFPIMDSLGIRTVCMNFMAYIGWFRSENSILERGGARVTGFDKTHCPDVEPLRITPEQLWDNLTYFFNAVVPYAERYGIRIALHPDDPPVPRLRDVSRILIDRASIQRALDIANSASVGVTLCQGSYAAMGEDIIETIKHFCKQDKTFFVHFRDIRGTRDCFNETFHDNGDTNMALAIQTYRDCNYTGPVRIDHVPTMANEQNDKPGYGSVGRLYAFGYLKGLLDGCGYSYC